ncbi:general secretion pathway protein GspI [Vibrio parahaemolyticus]|nr:general secretion pathway protein GspI [Vibrio parahaemolyticus]
MQKLIYCVPAPLNAALVCKRKNAAILQDLVVKAESLNCHISVQFQC